MIDLSLLQDFITEAGEHLEELEASLLKLETDPENSEILNDIFRSMHTIKGAAEFIGTEKISTLSHKLESLLETLRHGDKELNEEIIDILIKAKDRLSTLVDDLVHSQKEETKIDDLIEEITKLSNGDVNIEENSEKECAVEDQRAQPEEIVEHLEEALREPGDEDDRTTQTVTDKETVLRAVCKEINEEEYDKELFDIFIEQLKENLSTLRSSIWSVDSAENKTEMLNNCSDCVESLQSSANYMGYENLVAFYDDWRKCIAQALEELASGNEVLIGFMEENVKKVLGFFPQLRETDLLDLNHNGIDASNIKDSLEEKPEVNPVDEPISETGKHTAKDESEGTGKDRQLRDELSTAFDAFMMPEHDVSEENLQNEIEKLLFTQGDETCKITDPDHDGSETGIKPVMAVQNTNGEAEEGLFSSGEGVTDGSGSYDLPENLAANELPNGLHATQEQQNDRTGTERHLIKEEAFPEAHVKSVQRNIRVDAKKIDNLMNQVGELVVSRAWFSQLHNELRELQQYLKESYRMSKGEVKKINGLAFRLSEATVSLGRVAGELQGDVMKIRMLPISQLFNRYPRLVRDLVHNTSKEVRLKVKGEDTELDKMIIEQISDPLIHIIRNSVDHGIEAVEERKILGKPDFGRLTLEAYHESNHVVIEVSDDGQGIDPDLIKATAVEKNFCSKAELNQMTNREVLDLIVKPGFSTAAKVTNTSGRGVGMDVVKRNIEKLNGTIDIDSVVGEGTRFCIKIPLTLAIIPALLVRVGTEIYTIPLSNVEETIRISESETSFLEGVEIIRLRDRTLPLVRLSKEFGTVSKALDPDRIFVVIVSTGTRRVGLVVDELKGQAEVVIKPLVDYLQEKSGFSGATIIGDGRISLILDIFELVELSIGKQLNTIVNPDLIEIAGYNPSWISDARAEAEHQPEHSIH
ncbi:MAG: chemotaxis protein CheA [Thermodesulfobacteriota bacterium]|nr:chemotaxis protein CheA [Thermodesulfobacteriota bacterium]